MANEVSSLFVPYLIGTVARAGIDPKPHLHGLAMEHVKPSPLRRIDWHDVATFFNRVGEGLTTADVERLGDAYPTENLLIHATSKIIALPRLHLRVLMSVGQVGYRNIRMYADDLDDRRTRLVMRMSQDHTGCLTFFRGNVGEFRAMTELWGLGRSEVEADVSPWHGEYLITLPAAARKRAWPELSRQMADDFARAMEQLFSGGSEEPAGVLRLQREHGLTCAEARVATRLAAGRDVATIAGELGVGVETVRSHLKRAYTKTRTNRQAELVRLVLLDAESDA